MSTSDESAYREVRQQVLEHIANCQKLLATAEAAVKRGQFSETELRSMKDRLAFSVPNPARMN